MTTIVRAVLWDLDGTLVDSEREHWQSWHETFEARGLAVTEAQFKATFGQRNDRILAQILGPDAPAQTVREIGDAKEQRYRELVTAGGLTPLPGAAEWVKRLHAAGWRQAVASSAPRANVETVTQALQLRKYFSALVAAEDVTHGKPAPDVFLEAARRVAVAASDCVVVEDAEAGVAAAKAARMRCIGVGQRCKGADVVVTSLKDLAPDAFERLI